MQSGEWFVRGTAWLAFALWFAALALARRGTPPGNRGSNWGWLIGAVVMLLHTAFAFHFHHHWSHAVAVVDTACQTRELTGINWGGGVWLNYLFAAVWLGEASWRIAAPTGHARRPRWLTIATHAFIAFMWFNATVVFGSWPMRVAGVVAFGGLAALHYRRGRGTQAT